MTQQGGMGYRNIYAPSLGARLRYYLGGRLPVKYRDWVEADIASSGRPWRGALLTVCGMFTHIKALRRGWGPVQSRRMMILSAAIMVAGFQPAADAGHECRGRSDPPAGTRCDKSRISVRYVADTRRFSGDVDSHMRFCVRNRVVAVRQVRPEEDKTIGTARTNEKGWWRVEVAAARGKYYAVARYKSRSSPPDSVDICYRSKSKTIQVN